MTDIALVIINMRGQTMIYAHARLIGKRIAVAAHYM